MAHAVKAPRGERRADITRYYDQTWWDYRVLWAGRRDLAFHFGHHDATTRSHRDALDNTNRLLARAAGIRPGDRVLDTGCGVGGSSFWLAAHCAANVVGITCVGTQVTRARRLAATRGLSRPPIFLQADFMTTPFRGEAFDVVWVLESLCHSGDKRAFYREAARILRPSGRLVVAEYMLLGEPTDERGRQIVREWLDGWAMPDLASPAQHRAFALGAGLDDVVVEDATRRVAPSLRRLYRIAASTYPLALLARLLRMRSAVQHGNVIASLRQYQALRRGHWVYGVLSATKPAGASLAGSVSRPGL